MHVSRLPHASDVRSVMPALLATLAALLLLADADGLAALQKMAGYDAGAQTFFSEIQDYLENLRDSLIPLAIPLGAIGLAAGGAAYMVGNQMAQRVLGGVVVGIALTLMAPAVVA